MGAPLPGEPSPWGTLARRPPRCPGHASSGLAPVTGSDSARPSPNPPPPGVGGTPHPPPHCRGGTPGCSARPGPTPAGILIRFYTLCPRGLFLQPGRARLPLPPPPPPGPGPGPWAGAGQRCPPRPGAGRGWRRILCGGSEGVSRGGGGVTVAPARFRGCRLSGGCSLGRYPPPVPPAPSGNKGSIFPAPAPGESLPAARPLLRGTCPRCRRSPPAPGPPFPDPPGTPRSCVSPPSGLQLPSSPAKDAPGVTPPGSREAVRPLEGAEPPAGRGAADWQSPLPVAGGLGAEGVGGSGSGTGKGGSEG